MPPSQHTNSIFEQAWWWDVVAPKVWKAIEIKDPQGEIIARFPYCVSKNKLIMPQFTQTCGPWIKQQEEGKLSNILSREKNLLYAIIDQLPRGVNMDIRLDSTRTYILPFRWKGFCYEPTFSYILPDIQDTEFLFNNFASNIKSDIRKAEKIVSIQEEKDIEILINLQDKTFQRQTCKNPMSKDIIRRLHQACIAHNASKFLVSKDKEGRIHSAAYFVYDENRCYYLFSGADPKLRNSGAGSLVLWEGIKFASTVSKVFDFEGSKIEDIERFFRGFGATPIVNYRIYKFNFIMTMVDYLKPKIKHILSTLKSKF